MPFLSYLSDTGDQANSSRLTVVATTVLIDRPVDRNTQPKQRLTARSTAPKPRVETL